MSWLKKAYPIDKKAYPFHYSAKKGSIFDLNGNEVGYGEIYGENYPTAGDDEDFTLEGTVQAKSLEDAVSQVTELLSLPGMTLGGDNVPGHYASIRSENALGEFEENGPYQADFWIRITPDKNASGALKPLMGGPGRLMFRSNTEDGYTAKQIQAKEKLNMVWLTKKALDIDGPGMGAPKPPMGGPGGPGRPPMGGPGVTTKLPMGMGGPAKPPMGGPGKEPVTAESVKKNLTELIQKEKGGEKNVKSLEQALKSVEEFLKEKGEGKDEKKAPPKKEKSDSDDEPKDEKKEEKDEKPSDDKKEGGY